MGGIFFIKYTGARLQLVGHLLNKLGFAFVYSSMLVLLLIGIRHDFVGIDFDSKQDFSAIVQDGFYYQF